MDLQRRFARFRFDRWALGLMSLAAVILAAQAWLRHHPEHNPWAPLHLADPPGWATGRKLAALRNDPAECRAVLERSGVGFTSLDPAGEGPCRRSDRLQLTGVPLSPTRAESTCATSAALAWWLRHEVQPAARELLGSPVARIEHLGTYSCRRLYGGETGRWSEHATGNAIDVAAFLLEDGRRIAVLEQWRVDDERAEFLRRARNSACDAFGTVLSPDYNAAHADHFHLDQVGRFWNFCR